MLLNFGCWQLSKKEEEFWERRKLLKIVLTKVSYKGAMLLKSRIKATYSVN